MAYLILLGIDIQAVSLSACIKTYTQYEIKISFINSVYIEVKTKKRRILRMRPFSHFTLRRNYM